ncbi:hypothetical protein C8J57DRAFT_1598351 [Mycena rebaudengoi]|nr:hypothetical protein C8J57DRAFT_1598351 [Mycena rebaudengoi]
MGVVGMSNGSLKLARGWEIQVGAEKMYTEHQDDSSVVRRVQDERRVVGAVNKRPDAAVRRSRSSPEESRQAQEVYVRVQCDNLEPPKTRKEGVSNGYPAATRNVISDISGARILVSADGRDNCARIGIPNYCMGGREARYRSGGAVQQDWERRGRAWNLGGVECVRGKEKRIPETASIGGVRREAERRAQDGKYKSIRDNVVDPKQLSECTCITPVPLHGAKRNVIVPGRKHRSLNPLKNQNCDERAALPELGLEVPVEDLSSNPSAPQMSASIADRAFLVSHCHRPPNAKKREPLKKKRTFAPPKNA